MPDDDDLEMDCEYALGITDEESDALRWVMEVMSIVYKLNGVNASRALVISKFLTRWADHQITLHTKIHELEDILISKGHSPPGEKN